MAFHFLKRQRIICIAILVILVLFSTVLLSVLRLTPRLMLAKENVLNQVHGCPHVKINNMQVKYLSSFPLIVPHIQPKISCEDRLLEIVVVVNSACKGLDYRDLRNAIRKTWGNLEAQSGTNQYRVFFSLGICDENNLNIQESQKTNDLIIGNFTDSYLNIKFKTFMALKWAYFHFSSKFIVKTDDDVYVRVPRMLRWLQEQNYPVPFYGGFLYTRAVVDRRPRSKWYVSYEEYKDSFWPPFALGACTVFSTDSIPLFLSYTQFRDPFNTDDAYIGVAAWDLGIRAIQISEFKLFPSSREADYLLNATVIGDSLSGSQMESYYNKS